MMKINKATLLEALNDPAQLRRLRDLNRPVNSADTPANTVEDELADWLGRLKLLHGVPFNYLVPDVSMLPMESIKFFYCDTTWLAYLAEGALSLGRSATPDNVLDSTFLPELEFFSRGSMKKARGKVLGHLLNHLNEHEHKLMSSKPIPLNEKITGFLLRSGVVSDWEGLEVAAFADEAQKSQCQLLRMDHLSPNVLFCMYEGMVKSIRINEHAEVLHFGVANTDDGKPGVFEKSLRYPENKPDGSAKAGETVKGVKVEIPKYMRSDADGVVRINQLALDIEKALKSEKVGYKGEFTSAEFALEMVEGAEAVNFTVA